MEHPRLQRFAVALASIALLISLSSCRRTLTEPEVEKAPVVTKLVGEMIYPHPADWTKSGTHGAYFYRARKSCNTCHGDDLKGGTSKVSCQSCHAGFPHEPQWKAAGVHGSEFLRNPTSCKSCHGQDLKGGGVQRSCTECHQNFPHAAQWALPSNHGAAFIDGLKHGEVAPQKTSCLKCHSESDSEGVQRSSTQQFVSCKSCHKTFPHPDSEVWKREHGLKFVQNKGNCKVCHGEDLQGGLVGKSCATCHDKYPHAPDWAKPTAHGTTYVSGLDQQRDAGTRRPKDKQCLLCHTLKDPNPHPLSAQSVSCANCHVGMPHDKKMPDGKGGTIAHAEVFSRLDKNGRVTLLQRCFTCHSLTSEGGTRRNLPVSDGCNLCHGEPRVRGEQRTTYDPNAKPVPDVDVDVVLDKVQD